LTTGVVIEKLSFSVERYLENVSSNSLNLNFSLNNFLPNFSFRGLFESFIISNNNTNISITNQYLSSFNPDRIRHLFEPIIVNTSFTDNNVVLPNPRLYSFSNVTFYAFLSSKKVIFAIVSLSLLFIGSILCLLYNIINYIMNGIQAYIKKLANSTRSAGFRGFNHTMPESRRSQYLTQAAYFPRV
jgi:hypothetical protein